MRSPHKALSRLASHALGGRIGRDQLRVLLFQALELAHDRVEFGVCDLGSVQHVIQIFVPSQLLSKLFDFLGDGSHALK